MAVKFLEPGGDATFNVALTSAGGFWNTVTGTPTVATDFVHGNHKKSIRYAVNAVTDIRTITAFAGSARISYYTYFNALPSATSTLGVVFNSSANVVFRIRITSAGVLQLWNDTAQIGSNGSTLSTGIWYRLCLAFTWTSSSVNELRFFKDGSSDISVTNGTLGTGTPQYFGFGNLSGNLTLDVRTSDHYIDDSNSLTDTGNIWVTAKRPNANGTTNGFTTQIGAGGSGYGSGHSPQVNERALSNTNGWSMVGAGSAITEEYNIEAKNIGDIDISAATIVDWLGWADMSSLAGETVQMILNGANVGQNITSSETLYYNVKGSATYPAGTGADIGITTATSLTTVSLYECGVVVAYIPSSVSTINVSESTAITDNIVLYETSCKINVSDTITVTDSATLYQTSYKINVFNSTAVTDNLTIKSFSYLNVSDQTSVTDSVTITIQAITSRTINVSDQTVVTDNFTNTGTISRSVFDSTSVTDNATITIQSIANLTLNVNDSTSVTDSTTITIQAITPNSFSVSDSTSVTDSITITIQSIVGLTIIVNDQTSVTDSSTITIQAISGLSINVYNQVTITDVKYIVARDITVLVDSYSETKQDSFFTIATPTFWNPAGGQSFNGNGTILDNVLFYIAGQGLPTGNAYAKIYDHSGTFGTSSIPTGTALAVSDPVDTSLFLQTFALIPFKFSGVNNITLDNGTHYVVVYEFTGGDSDNTTQLGIDTTSPTASGNSSFLGLDSVTWTAYSVYDAIFYVYGKAFTRSTFDTTTVTDSATLVIQAIGVDSFSVNDSTVVTDSTTISIQAVGSYSISVSDVVTITESTTLVIQAIGIDAFSVNDQTTVTDVATVYETVYFINVSNSIIVIDAVTMVENNYLNVSDIINVTDSATVYETSYKVNVSELIIVTDSATILITIADLSISVFDTITVTDFVGYFPDTIYVSDSVTLVIQAQGITAVNVYDQTVVTDSAIITVGSPQVNVSDTVTATDSATITIQSIGTDNITVFDTITVTDAFNYIASNELISIIEYINVTDFASFTISSPQINIYDSVTVTDFATLALSSPQINAADTVTVTDSATIALGFQAYLAFSVFDIITVTDLFNSFTGNLSLTVYDTITVKDSGLGAVVLAIISYAPPGFDLIFIVNRGRPGKWLFSNNYLEL